MRARQHPEAFGERRRLSLAEHPSYEVPHWLSSVPERQGALSFGAHKPSAHGKFTMHDVLVGQQRTLPLFSMCPSHFSLTLSKTPGQQAGDMEHHTLRVLLHAFPSLSACSWRKTSEVASALKLRNLSCASLGGVSAAAGTPPQKQAFSQQSVPGSPGMECISPSG